MAAVLMTGAPVVAAVKAEIAEQVDKLAAGGVTVGLGTILVGDDPASAKYIGFKQKACEELGLAAPHVHIPASGTQAELMAAVERFNADPAVHAFLVQSPVPAGFDFNEAMRAIDPAKDADGLHPTNLGLLALGVQGAPRPCTPMGIQALLRFYEVPIAGRHVVVVGRGVTLGRPLSMLLSLKEPGANAAVTVVHTGVPDIASYTREADIVVAAVGVPNIIQPDMVRPGAAVVGGGQTFQGKTALSDVDESVGEVAGWITPRWGGVGPTTVAMLLRNAVDAASHTV